MSQIQPHDQPPERQDEPLLSPGTIPAESPREDLDEGQETPKHSEFRKDDMTTSRTSSKSVMAILLALLGSYGCAGSDGDGNATLKIVNGESGCTLSQVYLTPAGEDKGANLVSGNGIGYNATPRAFPVEAGEVYSVSVSSNTTTSNLIPEAKCSVHLRAGETRIITYSYDGGPSLYYGVLSGCD
jgi:hypothetical protein